MAKLVSIPPVMARQCPSCPFRDGEGTQHLHEIREMVSKRCLTERSQLCHHPQLKGKKQTHICRGSRNLQLEIFHRLGVIPAPTDKAWRDTWNKIQRKKI